MHVVHVIYFLDVGGGEVFLCGLARALAARGVAQHVFTIGPRGRLAAEVEAAGVPVTAFNKSSKAGLAAIARMASALGRLRPTLVHTHGEGGVLWGLPAARLAGVPAVSLVYQNQRETRLKTLAARAALGTPVLVLAGSRAVAEFVHGDLGVPRDRLRTIYCGIEPADFAGVHVSTQIDDGGPTLLTVGRLVSAKGHRTLVEAFARVRRRHARARLVIAGDGPEQPALAELAARLNVADGVTFAGTVYPTHDLLRRADVFVFPSLAEPQGLALVEAFAAGVPAVASRTGGIAEMLEHERHGLLVEPGDAGALAAAIERLLEDDGLRAACAAHARLRARDFDVTVLAGEYLDAYREIAREDVVHDASDASAIVHAPGQE